MAEGGAMKPLLLALLLVGCSQEPKLTWYTVADVNPFCTLRVALDEQGREWGRERHCSYEGKCAEEPCIVTMEISGDVVGIATEPEPTEPTYDYIEGSKPLHGRVTLTISGNSIKGAYSK